LEDILAVATEFQLNATLNCWILKSAAEAAKVQGVKAAVDNFILRNLSTTMMDPGFALLTYEQVINKTQTIFLKPSITVSYIGILLMF